MENMGSKERRKYRRVPVQTIVFFRLFKFLNAINRTDTDSQERKMGNVINISEGGIRFSYEASLPLKTTFTAEVNIPPAPQPMIFDAETVWCDKFEDKIAAYSTLSHIGAKFTKISDENSSRISEYVRKTFKQKQKKESSVFVGNIEGNTVITLHTEDLDSSVFERFSSEIENVISEENITKFILNFSEVKFIDSVWIGFILSCYKNCHGRDANLVLAGVTGYIKKIISTVGMNKVMPVFGTLGEALRWDKH